MAGPDARVQECPHEAPVGLLEEETTKKWQDIGFHPPPIVEGEGQGQRFVKPLPEAVNCAALRIFLQLSWERLDGKFERVKYFGADLSFLDGIGLPAQRITVTGENWSV